MKNFLLVIMTMAVVGLLVMFLRGGCVPTVHNTPHDITRAAIESLEEHNVDKTCSYFSGAAYNQMREGLYSFFTYDTITVDNLVVDVLEETNTMAKVYTEYDLRYSFLDYSDTERITKTVRCVKEVDGKWYLSTTL